ncbi:MAG: T9SS type A sorting domain-containing protein [Crocinitomicaceae bacterium]|nr:T9SS type A sorting domain-containing protein [Crocinitomicaceae bacterium]
MLTKITRLAIFLVASPTIMFGQEMGHESGVYKFQENKGQWPDHVNFKADVQGGNIWLEKNRIIYHFYQRDDFHHHLDENLKQFDTEIKEHLIYARFLGSAESPVIEKRDENSEYYNYFKGNDPAKWAKNVRSYGAVNYKELYPGVDLNFYEKNGQLKYEYELDPGADPSQIQLKYYGALSVEQLANGDVKIKGPLGEIIEEKPFAYQIKDGNVLPVNCDFKVSDDYVLSFELGEYDPTLKLVIDPVLVFATYSGSVTDNFGMTATYAYDGSAYSAGMIYGNAYPAPAAAWNNTPNITVASTGVATTDAFVSKYSADGTTMIWTNFVGGGDNTQGTETVNSMICDSLNNIYLFGVTSSLDFPLMNAVQTSHAGGSTLNVQFNGTNFGTVGTDIYVTKISADGLSLMGSTYMGGAENDGVNYNINGGMYNSVNSYDSLTSNYGDQFRGEIYLDNNNNVIIASSTRSTDFPIVNGFQNSNAGQQDGVVFKLTNDLSSLLWSTYFGGAENDALYGVTVNSMNDVVVSGGTSSLNIPGTVGAVAPNYLGGKTDGVIAVISSSGTNLMSATYIGSTGGDQTFMVKTDDNNNVYIVGQTGPNMPVLNAPYFNAGSGQFITKFSPDLSGILYSTVFGSGSGNSDISPAAFALDQCENVYVSGWGANILQSTPMSGMPVTSNAYQPTPANGFDFYLFVLERDAQDIIYGSYIGGSQANEHVDGGTSRFDDNGVLYQSVCGGCGGNSDFQTTPGAWSSQNLSTNCNNLVFKFDFESEKALFQMSQNEGCAPVVIDLTNQSSDTLGSSWILPPQANVITGGIHPQISFDVPGTYDISLVVSDPYCSVDDTLTQTVNIYPPPPVVAGISADTSLLSYVTVNLWVDAAGSASNFTWADNINFTNPIASGPNDSTIAVNPTVTTTYYVLISSGSSLCDVIDSVTVFVDPNISIGTDQNLNMLVYPNPFNDKIVVESSLEIESIQVLDEMGREVLIINEVQGKQEFLDLSKISKGVYVVRVINHNGSIHEKKIIKK